MSSLQRTDGFVASAPRSRILVVAAFATALVGSPGPLTAQTPPPTENAAPRPANTAKTPVPDLKPFDLSYVPTDATSLIAFRPAEILRREDMKPHVETLHECLSVFLAAEGGLMMPIKLESIEQVSLAQTPRPRGKAEDWRDDRDSGFCLRLRQAGDADWGKNLDRLSRDAKLTGDPCEKVAFEGRHYYKLKEPQLLAWHAPSVFCYFSPEPHTVIVADEQSVRGVIRSRGRDLPELARGRNWEEFSPGLMAFAANADGPEDQLDPFKGLALEFLLHFIPAKPEHSRRIHAGLDRNETLRIRISDDYDSPKAAGDEAVDRIAGMVESRVLSGIEKLGAEADSDPEEKLMLRCWNELIRSCRIRANGPIVEIESRCRLRLAEIVNVFSPVFEGAPAKGDKQTAAKPSQRETR